MEKLVPKLRFPEFDGNWKKEKLKNVSTYFNGGSFENDVKEDGKYELVTLKSVDMSGNLAHSKRYIDVEIPTLRKGTLVMILSEQSPGLLGMTAIIPEENKYVLNQRVAEIRPKNEVESYFLSMAINRNQHYFSKHGAGTKVQNISKPNVENYIFLCPKLDEQQKIASFLTSVDERLTLLAQQKEKLELYKKGVMQQIFSQKLRFKDENGNNYPDWEEKKLENIATYRRGSFPQPYGLPKWYDDLNGTPFVQVYDVDDNFRLKNTTKQKISDLAKPQSVFVKKGSIIITIQGSIGRIAITQYDSYVDRTLLIFQKFNSEIDKVFFVYSLFLLFEYEKTIAVGGTIKTITKEKINDFEINLPCLEEQQKIASFLSAIDVQIEGVSKKIKQTKLFKKGLLQQMFV